MSLEFDKRFVGPVAFVLMLPVFLILSKFDLGKQGLFLVSTTGSFIYAVYIELEKGSSKFLKSFLIVATVIHCLLTKLILVKSELDFLERSYTATGLGLSYFTVLYFIFWILRRIEAAVLR